MKDYYQYQNTGYKLPKEIYAKTVKTIRAYDYYQGVVNSINNRSEITEKDINNKITAEWYINSIDRALSVYVAVDLREAVFAHVARGVEYIDLEAIYPYSAGTLKRWVQRFVYGVAVEFGEDYR